MKSVSGLHHITAVASDPQQNVSFYQQVLGQRLVKTTVNFDDPGTYHLYYGDQCGSPGTILTFFPWSHMGRGRVGSGETSAVAYAIRPGSISYWSARLPEMGVEIKNISNRFGAEVIVFEDPDGMVLELVATADAPDLPVWSESPVPSEHALRGFYSVTLLVHNPAATERVLTEHLGYQFAREESHLKQFVTSGEAPGMRINLAVPDNLARGSFGAGSVHHIAFRASNDQEQSDLRMSLVKGGLHVTEVKDRQYFRSIYFREPSGVLFEIATDDPGFLIDEDISKLGSALKLPPWYENNRARIEAALPPIDRNVAQNV